MMHKMCSDERKCAVMKGCFCSDEHYRVRVKKVKTQYLEVTTKKRSSEFLRDEKEKSSKR